MQVVQIIDRTAKTYSGPWEWHNQSIVSGDYMLFADAVAQGYSAFDFSSAVPHAVIPWKLRAELGRRNLTHRINEFIAAQPEVQKVILAAAWEYASEEIPRKSSFVSVIASGLSLTSETVDDIFRKAEAIRGA